MTVVDEFVHSAYVRTKNGGDAVIMKVHRHDTDTGIVTPELKILKDMQRPFYITKKGLQNHAFKKEWAPIRDLDKYVVRNNELGREISKALNGYVKGNNNNVRELCNSPFVYGADISIETLIKKKYMDDFIKSKLSTSPLTTGFLDIETSMLLGSEGELLLITVTHENRVYTAILDNFFYKVDKKTGNRIKGDLEELKLFCKTVLDERINAYNSTRKAKYLKSRNPKPYIDIPAFEYNYFIGKTPVDLIRWIFSRIHKNKTDFIGIWNIQFDINVIIDILTKNRIPLEDIFCPPELPEELRYVKYKEDTSPNVPHFSRRWHWLSTTGYSQFVDSMCLYSRLRTVKGYESGGYSLDNILKINEISDGKLTFKDDDSELDEMSKADWHRHMQTYECYKYIAYNQFDSISLQLNEWKNGDIGAMCGLVGPSHLASYNKTTRIVIDSMYFYCLDNGMVLATAGTDMSTEFDKLISKTGGAVLKSENSYKLGLNILADIPNMTTMISSHAGDLDFSSLYPSIQCAINTARETKVSTAVLIEGFNERAMQLYHSLLISIPENAVKISHDFFKLPDYLQLEQMFVQHLEPSNQPTIL